MEIRKAGASDAERILEYCKGIDTETDNLTFGAEGVSITVEREHEYLESIRNSDRQLYLVTVNDGKIVGTAVFSRFAKARPATGRKSARLSKRQCGGSTSERASWRK